ncbi:MAG TPA: redoxin domain-containing protein [Candidatus Acidoferrales bacterium]|nr:redoxin domain-containing protein [Candidatus Acidoferrales bacterium]
MSTRSARKAARRSSATYRLAWLTTIVLFAGVMGAIIWANHAVPKIATQAPPFNTLSVGDAAPPFSVTTAQGQFTLASARRPVFLEVFATWCPHCQHETAVINALYEQYKNRIDFIAVSGSPYAHDRASPESLTDVLGFIQYFHVRYPVAFDPTLKVADNYLQGGYPTIAIIGSNKRVAFIGTGELARKQLAAEIRRVERAKS